MLFGAATFLVGGIPFAYLIGKLHGIDIRKIGSGNIGVTNLVRALGLPWGVLALLGDGAKGAVPVYFASRLYPESSWMPFLIGAVAVIGHCFTPYLRFRGGKGVATAAGVLCALDPLVLATLFAVWLAGLVILRVVGIASSLAAVAAIAFGVQRLVSSLGRDDADAHKSLLLAVLLCVLAVLVLWRHRRNLAEFFRARPAEHER